MWCPNVKVFYSPETNTCAFPRSVFSTVYPAKYYDDDDVGDLELFGTTMMRKGKGTKKGIEKDKIVKLISFLLVEEQKVVGRNLAERNFCHYQELIVLRFKEFSAPKRKQTLKSCSYPWCLYPFLRLVYMQQLIETHPVAIGYFLHNVKI